MKTPRITTGFTSLTDANFLNKSQSICDFMKGNTNFPTPVPAIADVQAAVTA